MKRSPLIIAFIGMGFSAMMSQVILLRELVQFFTGNELTLGIILGLWLLWTAIGSGLIGRLVKYVSQPLKFFVWCQLFLVFLLPATIIFIRTSKLIFSIPAGEMAGPIFIFVVPLLALAPICMIIGFLYTLGCNLLAGVEKNQSAVPGRVFLFEAMGSGVAGFVASMILFRFLENFQVVTIVCILNIMIAIYLWTSIQRRHALLWLLVSVFLASSLIVIIPKIDRDSNQKIWGGLQLLQSKNSIYGNIAVTQFGESISFYENGMLLFTHPDLMSAEEAVHFALLEHPRPETVLLIGGDAAGNIPQVLSHPSIKRVDFVLLDPTSMQLAKKFLPSLTDVLQDRRIYIWYEDGRAFVRRTHIRYDVVIVNLPEPQTTLINRFFTLEFYRSVRAKLNENGILSFAIPSSENVLSREQQIFLSCLYRTLGQVFQDIVLIPGNSIHFIACLSENILSRDPQILIDRLQQRRLPTLYVREYYIPFRMSPDRMSYISDRLTTDNETRLNRDFRPVGYFYQTILWLSFFNRQIGDLAKFSNRGWQIGLALFLLILIFILWRWMSRSGKNRPVIQPGILLTIMTIGFTGISLELLIILGFQAIYGYAYYQLALIATGYMIGLTFGSWQGLNSIKKMKSPFNRFLRFQSALIFYPALTFGLLLTLSKFTLPDFFIQAIFLLLIIGVGFIAGFQFPLANHLIYRGQEKVEIIGSIVYAWDLLGSVIGAMMTSTLLVPILGLGYTCLVFGVVNFLILGLLILSKSSSRLKPA